jgi:LysR family tcuABC transcriptional regulator
MPSLGHGLRGRLEAICQEHALSVDVVAEIDGLALLMRAVRDGWAPLCSRGRRFPISTASP